MSTKIHHGYRLWGVAGSSDLFSVLSLLRGRLEPTYERAYYAAVVKLATEHADRVLGGEALDPEMAEMPLATTSPLLCAAAYLDKIWNQTLRRGIRFPEFDFQCEVVILADPDRADPLYALLHTERADYEAVWEAMPGVEPWPYWNNTDRQEGVSWEAWESRRLTWERALGPGGRLSRGMTWSLLGDSHHFEPMLQAELVAAAIPDRMERARWVAGRRVPFDRSKGATKEFGSAVDALAAEIEPTLADLDAETLRRLPGAV